MALHVGNLGKHFTTFVTALLFTCLLLLVLSQSSISNNPKTQYRLCRVDGDGRPLERESHPNPQDNDRKGKPKAYTTSTSKPHSQTNSNEDNLNKPGEGELETRLTIKSLFKANHLLLNFSHAKDQAVKEILRPHGSGVLWTSFSPTGTATRENHKKYHADNRKTNGHDTHTHNHHDHVHVHGNQTLQYEGPREGEKLPLGISMFHAMHCLLYLRKILQDVLQVPTSSTPTTPNTLPEDQHPEHDDGHHHDPETHIPHCWSYLTQQVMCLGDTTLEPPWIERDAGGRIQKMGIDGHGVHHTCQDLDRLSEVVGKAAGTTPNGKAVVFEDWGWRDGQRVEGVDSLFV